MTVRERENGVKLWFLFFRNSKTKKQSLTPSAPRFAYIEFHNVALDQDKLAAIGELPNLLLISISTLSVGEFADGDLAHFKNVKSLERLQLFHTDVTGEGLACLANLPKLRQLWIEGTTFNDAGISALGRHLNIEALELDGVSVTDVGLSGLSTLSNLKKFDCSGTPFSDAAIEHFAEIDSLETLTLNDTRLTGATLGKLRGLKNLRKLDLGFRTLIADDAIPELSTLQQLDSLYLCGLGFSDEGMQRLTKALPNTFIGFSGVQPGRRNQVSKTDSP